MYIHISISACLSIHHMHCIRDSKIMSVQAYSSCALLKLPTSPCLGPPGSHLKARLSCCRTCISVGNSNGEISTWGVNCCTFLDGWLEVLFTKHCSFESTIKHLNI